MEKINVLVIEKWTLLQSALSSALEKDPEINILGVENDLENAIPFIKEKKPDIILLDAFTVSYKSLLEHNLLDGIESRFILASPIIDLEIIKLGVKSHVKGFIIMNISPEELVEAIKTVYKGESYISKEITLEIFEDFANLNDSEKTKLVEPLTKKEEEILHFLKRGLSNKEIANILGISEKTVKSHLTNIYSKLNVSSRLEAVLKSANIDDK